MERCFDVEVLQEALNRSPAVTHIVCDLNDFINDRDNIVLTDGKNVGVLEYVSPGIYNGHYLFVDRGNKVVDVAREMIEKSFQDYPVNILQGLTPSDHLGALWLNNKLGFKDHGEIDTIAGKQHVVTLTRDDFFKRINT